jgi:GntR family transcriptional regulator, rspAB operon transcriptional repressor
MAALVKFDLADFSSFDGRALTTSARISAHLRDQIVTSKRAPGMALSEKDIAEEFGVSRTPVREALLRLAEERLVDIYPQIGTFVSRISAEVVRDAMAIRIALERFSASEAAKRAPPDSILELEGVLRQQRQFADADDIAGFHQADEAMHQLIATMAGHPNIWRVVKREKVNVDRARLLTLQIKGRFQSVTQEHAKIVGAIRAHAPAAADQAMVDHLSVVLPGFAALHEKYPDYFEAEGAVRKFRPKRLAKTPT